MKKILIIIGIVLILLMIGVWVYLFLYGAPANVNEIFAKFGTTTGEEPTFTNPPSETNSNQETSTYQNAPKVLRQLTLRPVAGAGFHGNMVRFVEQGTGHVYDISPTGENETIVSGTTIPQAIEAVVSPDGTRVAITKLSGGSEETVVGSLGGDEGTLTGNLLSPGTREVSFTSDSNHIRYIVSKTNSSVGYDLDLTSPSTTSTIIFTIPLRDIRVLWGKPTYIVTTPTADQVGYVYKLNKSVLEYVTSGGRGLMAIPYQGGLSVTKYTNEADVIKFTTETVDDHRYSFITALFSEKCTGVPYLDETLICATPVSLPGGKYPDDWYKGVVSLQDDLWYFDIKNSSAVLLSDLLLESGRSIDISTIGTDPTGRYIYFTNKNDNTLWLFDRDIASGAN